MLKGMPDGRPFSFFKLSETDLLDTPLAIFAGRSNLALSRAIAESYGASLGDVTIKSFSDGELYVKYEQSIRGEDIFVIQSTPPPGENIIELLLLLDAAKRSEEHTSELQSRGHLVCRLLLEKKKQ